MSDNKLPFPDISGIISQFKLPGIDLQALVEARRADVDALRQANTIALAGAQRIAEKQVEILRTTLGEVTELLRELPQHATNPSGLATKQSEIVQAALGRAFGNMKELAEAAQQSQTEVVEVLGKRMQENLSDLRKLLKIGE